MFNSSDQLTGPYILNFSYLDANGKLSGISNSAKVIFDPSTKTFTVNGKTHEYYYSWFGWGQYGEARPIIILDDRHGGYYAITQANIDLSKIIFKKETTLEEPKFSDAWTIWDLTALAKSGISTSIQVGTLTLTLVFLLAPKFQSVVNFKT